MKDLFRSLFDLKPFMRRYKWRYVWGILFVLAANALGVQVPAITGLAVNVITQENFQANLFMLVTFLVAIATLAGCFRYLMRRVLIDTSRDVEFDFRNHAYRHLQKLDSTFYDNNSTGDIMSRMTNDIDAIRLVLGPAIMYSANTIFLLPMALGYMLLLDWRVALAGLAPMITMPILVKKFGARLHRAARAQQDQLADLTTYVQESLAGSRVLKAYGQEESSANRFDQENDLFIEKSLDLAKVQAFFFPTIRLMAGIGLLAILYFGARRIIAGAMDFGTLVAMVMYFGMLVWPLVAAGWVINIYQRAASAMDRLNEVLQTEPKVQTSEAAEDFAMPDQLDIEFRDLTFTYEGAREPALRNITLTIPAGERLGIVGRVGAGKSTLVNLLLHLYPVERGQLFIGGIDINDWPLGELRRAVGIVFQETFLFSDTIANNVRFGASDDMPIETVREYARKADVDKDIREFPESYDTMLGERGINLSGGQKQRVSLARAMSRDARIMVLDDSLSAVDTHTEEAILGELGSVMEGRTTLLISHRISTVALCDTIIVLEDGAITQRGTHEQLAAEEGLYQELHQRQLLEEEAQTIEA